MVVVFTLLTGGVYPLVVTGIAQLLFHDKANGSLIKVNGAYVGSHLIGQQFTKPQYFHPRPSSAGDGYDGSASSGSNLGPTNDKLLNGQPDDPATKDVDESYDGIKQRAEKYRQDNGLAADALVPVDAVTGSGSGLDPDISLANARIQAARVAQVRNLPLQQVLDLINRHIDKRGLGFLGEPGVNVLELNLDLDRQ
jgi:K+-transporting ATPase ATPase C chain